MRWLFGLIALLLSLLVVLWLVRTQLSTQAGLTQPAGGNGQSRSGQTASAALEQFKKSLERALKTPPASDAR